MKFNIERGETNAITYKDADLQYVLACAAKACVPLFQLGFWSCTVDIVFYQA